MKRRIINPWTWQTAYGFVQGVEVPAAGRTLYCAGQTAVDDEGNPVGGDMSAQVTRAMDNLEKTLAAADMKLRDVVRLSYFVSDMAAFYEAHPALVERLNSAECQASGCLLQVAGFAMPGILVEIEATAVAST